MEITQHPGDGLLKVVVNGRLDGYWADYLDRVLSDAIRDGHHQVRIDCGGLVFLSSAGIAVLMKFHKELARINGGFQVINPSKPVSATLKLTRLDVLLIEPVAVAPASQAPAEPARAFTQDGAEFESYTLEAARPVTCRVVGHGLPVASANAAVKSVNLDAANPPVVAVGVGAFGDTAADCQCRFGEFLSVAGATAYQPADGTNVPDYLVASGLTNVHVLGCLSCDGSFSRLVRFEASGNSGETVGLSAVLGGCAAAAETDVFAVVMIAEADYLVGAALRKSPAELPAGTDFFGFPDLRTRLAFTAEPAYRRTVALLAGVVAREGRFAASSAEGAQLRSLGHGFVGHVHAAAFRFSPIRKGPIDLTPTVTSLFEPDRLQGVLHLINDDRGAAGAGESQFARGACWVGPISGAWQGAA